MTTLACREEVTEFVGAEQNRLVATVYGNPSGLQRGTPPILFMHGGGQTRHSWHGAAQLLAERGNLTITVDARGHGDSDWVASGHYTFEHYSDDLRCLTGQVSQRFGEECGNPVVVGASMGGISAMIAQADDGDHASAARFSAIVLVDITPRMEPSGVDKILGFMAQDMRAGFADIQAAADAIADYLPHRSRPRSNNGLSKNLRQRDDGRWYWHWDPAFLDGPHNVQTRNSERQAILSAAARKIDVPTLLVRGAKSELVTVEAAREFVELVPHARYVDVSEAGHMVAGDKNDNFAAAVTEFLTEKGLA